MQQHPSLSFKFHSNVVPFSKTTPAPTLEHAASLWLHDTGRKGRGGASIDVRKHVTNDKRHSINRRLWNLLKLPKIKGIWLDKLDVPKQTTLNSWVIRQTKWWMVFFFTSTTCSSTNFSTDSQNQHPVEPLSLNLIFLFLKPWLGCGWVQCYWRQKTCLKILLNQYCWIVMDNHRVCTSEFSKKTTTAANIP